MRTIASFVTIAVTVLCLESTAHGQAVSGTTSEDGIAAFRRIATVLQHPRCLNCHQPASPLQGDAARPHRPPVARGPDDKGVSAMRCANCHREANNPASGASGAPHWQLAPASMDWSGLSVGELCRILKDPRRNGNRSLQALVEHMERDPLVLWGWAPGGSRSAIPIGHKEFVDLLRVWAAADGPCPT